MLKFVDCRCLYKEDFKIKQGYQPQNALFYILEGEFEYIMGKKKERVCENELVCFPDTIYFERTMIKPMRFYQLRFDNAENRELHYGKLYIHNKTRMLSSFEYLIKVCEMGNETAKQHFFDDILIQIDTDAFIRKTRQDDLVSSAQVYFAEHIKEKIKINDVANALGISVSGLTLHFKKAMNLSPMHYLNNLRIEKAEAFLCNTSMRISEISEECGFDNAYYFCNVFKKYKHISPVKFRNMYGV